MSHKPFFSKQHFHKLHSCFSKDEKNLKLKYETKLDASQRITFPVNVIISFSECFGLYYVYVVEKALSKNVVEKMLSKTECLKLV